MADRCRVRCVCGIVAVLTAAAAPVVSAQQTSIDRVAWLQGCWQGDQGQSTVEEHWMAPRGGTMLGMSRTVRGGAMTSYELVAVKEEGGRLAYHAHPSGQPSNVFLSQSITETTIVFEDLQHDFPQRVGYRKDGTDTLLAWIEGTNRGQARRVEFVYRRVRCAGS